MKFLLSEGRTICLLEREDADAAPATLPKKIDLLLIPFYLEDNVKQSHLWTMIESLLGDKLMKNTVYF